MTEDEKNEQARRLLDALKVANNVNRIIKEHVGLDIKIDNLVKLSEKVEKKEFDSL